MRRISRSPSYLIRTPYSYCFRLNVPHDLQRFVGKTELRYSLKTGYISLAKSRARLLAGQVQRFFRELRWVIEMGELTQKQIREMVNKHFRNLSEFVEMCRIETGSSISHDSISVLNVLIQKFGKRSKDGLVNFDYDYIDTVVHDLLKREGFEVEPDSIAFRKISREVMKGFTKFGEIEERRNGGDYSDNIEAAFPLSSDLKADQTVSIAPKKKPSIPIEDVIEEYKKRKVESGKWRQSVVRNHEPKMRTMLQVLGNRPVNSITVDDGRRYAKLLELLPPGFAKLKEYADISGLTPKDLDGKHGKTLDVSTRIGYLNFARSVFEYAEECEYIEKNPIVKGLIPPKKKNTRGQKLPFDDPGDLDKIFNHSAFLGACKNLPSRFWVPLLALYSGCRLEELCQLHKEDVQEIDGIWCLNIKGLTSAAMDDDEDDDQMLKTDSAPRVVPLHPFIVDDLKFPVFVKVLKNKRGRRVFPELKKKNFKYGHELSKWFNRRLRTKKVGITDRKKTFHSFRHNVSDHLYKKLVQESLIEELEGRAGKTETRKRYTTGQLVQNLYEECILKLDYQVDLSHLKNSRFVPR